MCVQAWACDVAVDHKCYFSPHLHCERFSRALELLKSNILSSMYGPPTDHAAAPSALALVGHSAIPTVTCSNSVSTVGNSFLWGAGHVREHRTTRQTELFICTPEPQATQRSSQDSAAGAWLATVPFSSLRRLLAGCRFSEVHSGDADPGAVLPWPALGLGPEAPRLTVAAHPSSLTPSSEAPGEGDGPGFCPSSVARFLTCAAPSGC